MVGQSRLVSGYFCPSRAPLPPNMSLATNNSIYNVIYVAQLDQRKPGVKATFVVNLIMFNLFLPVVDWSQTFIT